MSFPRCSITNSPWKKRLNWNEVDDEFDADLRRLTSLLSKEMESSNAHGNVLRPVLDSPFASSVFLGLFHRLGCHFEYLSRLGCHFEYLSRSCDNEELTLHAVRALLRLGCDPKVQNERGQSALHILTLDDMAYDFNNFTETLISFVSESERTSYVNTIDAYGHSAIFYAANRYDSASRISRLLDLGADPFMEDATGSTILQPVLHRLHTHNEEDSFHLIVRLLQLGCDPKIRDERGQTTLHILSKNHHGYNFNQVARTLISYIDESERPSYINATDADGKSAVWYASRSPVAFDRVDVMLDFGADPFVGDPSGSSVLHRLIQCIDSRNHQKSLQVMTRLVQLGCDPKAQDQHGRTALHILVENPNKIDFFRFAEVLISSVVDESEGTSYIDTTDADGNSAIFYAIQARVDSVKRLKTLLDFGADPSVRDATGSTILHKGFRGYNFSNDEDSVNLIIRILQLGCDPTAQDDRGETTLHILASRGSATAMFRYAEILISFVHESERASYLNAMDTDGNSAMFCAADSMEAYAKVSRLVHLQADPTLHGKDGRTLLHLTAKNTWKKDALYQLSLLLQHGADPTIADDYGFLPLDYLGSQGEFKTSFAFLLLRSMVGTGYLVRTD